MSSRVPCVQLGMEDVGPDQVLDEAADASRASLCVDYTYRACRRLPMAVQGEGPARVLQVVPSRSAEGLTGLPVERRAIIHNVGEFVPRESELEDCTRPGVPLVLLHQQAGPVLWPLSRIAMLRTEWDGRLEATDCEGEVAHRPGPLEPFHRPPLYEVAPGVLIHPAHVRAEGSEIRVPGGWRLPAANLPPPPAVPDADPDAVLAAVRESGRYSWLTLRGPRPAPATLTQVLNEQPDLLRAGLPLVRPGAVRRLTRPAKRQGRVTLEGGHEHEAGFQALSGLYRGLGIPYPDPLAGVPPDHRRVYACGLRDWPADLLSLQDADLQRRYAEDPRQLVDDVIWETYRLHSRGLGRRTNVRGLFYNPLKVLAARAGVLGRRAARRWERGTGLPWEVIRLLAGSLPRPGLSVRSPSQDRWTADRLWLELQFRLDLFVGEWSLLTYRDLGIVDEGAPNRRVGKARPAVILVVEKGSLREDALQVAERFGVSLLVLGGTPTWISTEFFADELRTATAGPVLLVSLCDFDPYGWNFPVHFARQLERYGIATEGIVRLVKPSSFTPDELDRLALDLPIHPGNRALVEAWVQETGGVFGLARGMYADFLQPASRIELVFHRETGLEPLS